MTRNIEFQNYAAEQWRSFRASNNDDQISIAKYFGVNFQLIRINGSEIRFFDEPAWTPKTVFLHKKGDFLAYARISKEALRKSLAESRKNLRLINLSQCLNLTVKGKLKFGELGRKSIFNHCLTSIKKILRPEPYKFLSPDGSQVF